MGQFGGFYKGEGKKPKKTILEKKAKKEVFKQTFVLPTVSIIKKGKDEA
jgi:hypothetical protein